MTKEVRRDRVRIVTARNAADLAEKVAKFQAEGWVSEGEACQISSTGGAWQKMYFASARTLPIAVSHPPQNDG
jgi:hypothetical protein